MCSGALREHLAEHDQDCDSPLVAVVPVSVRSDEGETAGNQLSAMFVPLSNDRKTPLERLRTVTAASTSCKGQERAVGYGPMATLLSDAVPPALAKPVIQLGVRSGVLRKLRAGNLMISNVPGPDFPLYFAGMELRAVHPLGPVVDGVALNITVQSYRDALFVGINAGATAVPDLPGLARAMVDELALLHKMAAGAGERGIAASARRRHPTPAHAGASPHPSTGRAAATCGAGRRPPPEPTAGRSASRRGTSTASSAGGAQQPGVGQGGPMQRSDLDDDPVAVAPRLLNKILVRGETGRPDRRGRGLPRGQRPGVPRVSRADAEDGGHVRAARVPLRVLHLRHALVRQRRVRPRR